MAPVSRTTGAANKSCGHRRRPITGMRDRSFLRPGSGCLTDRVPSPATRRGADPLATGGRARVAGSGGAGGHRPLPARAAGDGRDARRRPQRRAADAHRLPGGAGARPAGHGTAVGPLRASPAPRPQRDGLRGSGGGVRARPHPPGAPGRPASAGLRRGRRHGDRPRGDRRPRHRPGRGQGLHADDHRRWGRAGAGAAGREPAGRPGGLARDALDGRRPLRGHAARRPAGGARDTSARGPLRAPRGLAAGRDPAGARHPCLPQPDRGERPVLRRADGLHLVVAVRLPERRRPLRDRVRRRVRHQRHRADQLPAGSPAG